MEQFWETENRALCLTVDIKCEGKCLFRVVATDSKPKSKYADRTIEVDGFRTVYLSFPVSPKKIKVRVEPVKNAQKVDNYIVNIKESELKTYDIHTDQDTKEFLQLAVFFSQVSGFETASPNGRLFSTKDRKFNIRYFPAIVDFATNKVLNTPARIGHQTGTIETAKVKFDSYTIPMRMIILLHEFSHKYKNPKMGLEISNEVGADINALYIYLGLGFSKVDAIYVFANVFLKAQTRSNVHRMRKIMEYIKRFENEEFAKRLT
jgi:hypothetical protein